MAQLCRISYKVAYINEQIGNAVNCWWEILSENNGFSIQHSFLMWIIIFLTFPWYRVSVDNVMQDCLTLYAMLFADSFVNNVMTDSVTVFY